MSTAIEKNSGFHVASVAIDGTPVGMGYWAFEQLSTRWLTTCSDFLRSHGSVFDASWNGELSHVRTTFTSVSGAALATFFSHEKVVSSLLLMTGRSDDAERTLSQMFLDSIAKSVAARGGSTGCNACNRLESIRERPLLVPVAWPDCDVSDDEYECVRELALHLAGAFFKDAMGSE